MMRETSPEDVKLELDVYWLAKAGLNPFQSLTNAKDRVALVHLKDMAADGSTVELGAGTLDLTAIIRAASSRWRAGHLFVEQDESQNRCATSRPARNSSRLPRREATMESPAHCGNSPPTSNWETAVSTRRAMARIAFSPRSAADIRAAGW